MKLNSLRILIIALTLVLMVAAIGFMLGRNGQKEQQATVPLPAEEAAGPQMRDVTLYFAAVDGVYLAGEAAQIPECDTEQDCLRSTVEAMVKGPVSGLLPVLPAGTEVRAVTVQEGLATVDFGRSLVAAHPGGSSSELLTVYGLVNSLAVNFPHIRQVRILVEGEPLESLKGHVVLGEPVTADFRYTRLPEGAPPPVKAAEKKADKDGGIDE